MTPTARAVLTVGGRGVGGLWGAREAHAIGYPGAFPHPVGLTPWAATLYWWRRRRSTARLLAASLWCSGVGAGYGACGLLAQASRLDARGDLSAAATDLLLVMVVLCLPVLAVVPVAICLAAVGLGRLSTIPASDDPVGVEDPRPGLLAPGLLALMASCVCGIPPFVMLGFAFMALGEADDGVRGDLVGTMAANAVLTVVGGVLVVVGAVMLRRCDLAGRRTIRWAPGVPGVPMGPVAVPVQATPSAVGPVQVPFGVAG